MDLGKLGWLQIFVVPLGEDTFWSILPRGGQIKIGLPWKNQELCAMIVLISQISAHADDVPRYCGCAR
jgi:hypothetical protein